MSNTTLKIGTNVRLRQQIGGWPAGARGRVIPSPIRTIPYDQLNTTGERPAFDETANNSVWVIMVNEFHLPDVAKFAVDLSELEVVA